MTLQELTTQMAATIEDKSAIGASYKFNFTDLGVIHVDGTGSENIVTNNDDDAECSISVSLEDFMQLREDPSMGMQLFFQGKLRVEGDPTLAMRLQELLD